MKFLGGKKVQDLENRAAHPHQEFPGVQPPPHPIPLWGFHSRIAWVSVACKQAQVTLSADATVLLMNDSHEMASVDLSRDRCHIYFTFVFWSKTRKDQLIPTPKVYHDGFKGRNPWFIFGLSRELTKIFLTKQDEQ